MHTQTCALYHIKDEYLPLSSASQISKDRDSQKHGIKCCVLFIQKLVRLSYLISREILLLKSKRLNF